jgi:hypothetical protein
VAVAGANPSTIKCWYIRAILAIPHKSIDSAANQRTES